MKRKQNYDQEVDVLSISEREQVIEQSDWIVSDVIVDYDRQENIIGIEIFNAFPKIEKFSPKLPEVIINFKGSFWFNFAKTQPNFH